MKKLICLLLSLALFAAQGCTALIYADSTLSASVLSATTSPSLKQKLEELKKEVASKAAIMKLETKQKLENKVFVGTVSSNDGQTIILSTRNGLKTVNIDEYTNFQSKIKTVKKTALIAKNIAEGDYVATLGDVDDKGILVAKKVVKLEKIATDGAKLVLGKIESVSSPTLTLKLPTNNTLLKVITSPTTYFFIGQTEASIQDAKTDKLLIAKGEQLRDGSIKARFVYFYPTGTVKAVKIASPSSATSPSATSKKNR